MLIQNLLVKFIKNLYKDDQVDWRLKVLKLVNDDEKIMTNLQTYVDLVLEYNKCMNLTGFDEDTIWKEGIFQSIYLLNQMLNKDENFSLLDIGAGAGFPSIPYLIFRNNLFHLSIVESNKKRVDFLKMVKNKLSLNVQLINKRIEEIENQDEQYDFITARAVTSLKNLIEISSRVGKINSTYFFLKSKKYQDELLESQTIIKKLKIENISAKTYDLNDDKEHVIISYKKEFKTPQGVPRKWSLINKHRNN